MFIFQPRGSGWHYNVGLLGPGWSASFSFFSVLVQKKLGRFRDELVYLKRPSFSDLLPIKILILNDPRSTGVPMLPLSTATTLLPTQQEWPT
jgi:hypothetical protein